MEVSKLKQIGKGLTADIYAIDENTVLKLFKEKTYEIRKTREYEILKGIRIDKGSKIKIPNVYEFYEIENRKGFSMEFIKGESFESKYFLRLAKKCKNLAYIDYLISKDVHIPGDYYFKDFVRPIVEECEVPLKVKNYLLKNIDMLPDGEYTCYSDLHGENIILDQGKYCIIDWSEAGKCDYMAEIAKFLSMLQIHPYQAFEDETFLCKTLYLKVERFINKKLADVFLEEYKKYRQLDQELLQRWQMVIDTMMIRSKDVIKKKNTLNQIRISYEYFSGQLWGSDNG